MNYIISEPNLKILREPMISYRSELPLPSTLKGPFEVAAFLRLALPDNSREHVLALYLSQAHQPIAYKLISTGTISQSLVHVREVLQPALILGASAFILAHNHPSQDLSPSKEDKEVTQRLNDAAALLQIKMLDHIILSDTHHFSFAEETAML